MYNQTFCCPLHYKNGLFIQFGLLAILYQITTSVPHSLCRCASCLAGWDILLEATLPHGVLSPAHALTFVSRNSPSHLSNVLSLPWSQNRLRLACSQHPTSHYPTQVCSMGPGFQHPIISSWTFEPVTPPQPYLFGTRLVFKCWWVPSMETWLDLCKPKATTESLPFLVIVGSQRPVRVYLVINVSLSQWNCFFFQSVLRSVCFLAWKKAHTE